MRNGRRACADGELAVRRIHDSGETPGSKLPSARWSAREASFANSRTRIFNNLVAGRPLHSRAQSELEGPMSRKSRNHMAMDELRRIATLQAQLIPEGVLPLGRVDQQASDGAITAKVLLYV